MAQPKLPEASGWMGDPTRGAQMGRCNRPSLFPEVTRTFYLQKLRLDRGGYDSGGAYWGIGKPLWWATCPEGAIDFYFRAATRLDAKHQVKSLHPGARFYV